MKTIEPFQFALEKKLFELRKICAHNRRKKKDKF